MYLILESLGVNDSVKEITNIIKDDLLKNKPFNFNYNNNFTDVIIAGERTKKYVFNFNRNYKLNNIKNLSIDKLDINFTIFIYDNNNLPQEYKLKQTLGELKMNDFIIDKPNNKILSAKINITSHITKDQTETDNYYNIFIDSINHELNHILQSFKMFMSKDRLSLSTLNNLGLNKNVNNDLKPLVDRIYLSFNEELNSRLSQAYNILHNEFNNKIINYIEDNNINKQDFDKNKSTEIKNTFKNDFLSFIKSNWLMKNNIYLHEFNSELYYNQMINKYGLFNFIDLINDEIINNMNKHIDNLDLSKIKHVTQNNIFDYLNRTEKDFKYKSKNNVKKLYKIYILVVDDISNNYFSSIL